MRILFLSVIAFSGGVCLAVQAGFNSQLGVLLKKPIFASVATSISSISFALLFILFSQKEKLDWHITKNVRWYLWFIGGLFSIVGITLYYYTIPKVGIANVISLGLCGQLIFSVIASYYGWFDIVPESISFKKITGILLLTISVFLINSK